MISVAKKERRSASIAAVARQIMRLREELEDLNDYLDLLEARARNAGKRRFSTAEVREKLRL